MTVKKGGLPTGILSGIRQARTLPAARLTPPR